MRFKIKKVNGVRRQGRYTYHVRAYVVKDAETNWLFFVTRDPRFILSRVVRGGFPYTMMPREAWWDDVARYNLGPKDFDDAPNALAGCGCSLIKKFTWTADNESVMDVEEISEAAFNDLLEWTKTVTGRDSFAEIFRGLPPNEDYDCAETIDPALGVGPIAGSTTEGDEGSRAGQPRGVTTEVTSIISERYSTENDYVGYHSYHEHHGQTPNHPTQPSRKNWLVGVELEVECNNSECKTKLNRIHSNWFYQERDGSLGEYGTEIITVPLRPEDAKSIKFWEPMTRYVNTVAKSWSKPTTGLHVHISRSILGDSGVEKSETLGKLLYFYHHLVLDNSIAEKLNADIYGRPHTYNERIGKSDVGEAAKLLGKECLKMRAVTEKVKERMVYVNNGDRYFDINIRNSATIEFRKGKGSINPKRIVNIVAWSELMCRYCRETAWEDLSFDGFRCYVRDNREAPKSLKEMV